MFTAERDDPCDRYHRTPHSPASRDFPINPAAAAAAAEEDRPDLRHPAEEAAAAVPLPHQSQEGGGSTAKRGRRLHTRRQRRRCSAAHSGRFRPSRPSRGWSRTGFTAAPAAAPTTSSTPIAGR